MKKSSTPINFLFPELLRQNGYQDGLDRLSGTWGKPAQGVRLTGGSCAGKASIIIPTSFSLVTPSVCKAMFTDLITRMSEDWLDGRDTAKPFCLIVGGKGHSSRMAGRISGTWALYDGKDIPLPAYFFMTIMRGG